jgi:hypothetical protein
MKKRTADAGDFLFSETSRPALWPTQTPTLGSFPGGDAGHAPPSRAEIKNEWNYTSTPPTWHLGVERNKFSYFTGI